MDLNLSFFDTQAESANPCHDSPWPAKRSRLTQAHDDGDKSVPLWDSPGCFDQWFNYSAYDRREISTGNGTIKDDQRCPSVEQSDSRPLPESGKRARDVLCNLPPDVDLPTALLSCHPHMEPPPTPVFLSFSNPFSIPFHQEKIEPLHLVPNFYNYAITATLLPIRQVQHQLVVNYFKCIHPMFPVVDENSFTNVYSKFRGREHLMDPQDFMLYQAIMAAGFGHLTEMQLRRTPYVSVHEGQKAQFDLVKTRYWSEPNSDPVMLTQICLLISLWSPSSAGNQNNSYWISLALKHATTGELWNARPSAKGQPCRRRLLWWCCMVRDRVLALGMRRPYRLHKSPFEEAMVSENDFGLEATQPLFTDLQSKRLEMAGFIWLCRLSEIMAAIALFQRRNRFARDWNGDGNITPSELAEVSALDGDIREWIAAFEAHVMEITDQTRKNDAVPLVILRVVCNCLRVVLFQSYLCLSWTANTSTIEDIGDPLQIMKDGARAVESSVMGLVNDKKIDALPNWLVSWVTLPAAVHYVLQRVRKSAPDTVLVPCLNMFIRRTTGAKQMFLIMTKSTNESLQRNEMHLSGTTNLQDPAAMLGRRIAPAPHRLRGEGTERLLDANMTRITEAKVLARVTKALDSALELDC